jgi:hypothetical protein
MRKLVAVPTVACGLIATAISLADKSAAACDSADCVPNVARNVVAGAPCAPRPSFVFGLDAGAGTLICTPQGVWVPVGRLVGEREVTMPCFTTGDTAQQPLAGNDLQLMRTPGVPLKCAQINSRLQWVNFF